MNAEDERALAKELFNHAWTLMGRGDRSPADDDELLHCAHASRHHWGRVGGPEHRARGEWQCSRVYTVLGRGEPAIHHAQRCLALCDEHGLGDWDLAYAYEALARAHGVAGEADEAVRYRGLAREAGEAIRDPEDREHFEEDLATL